MKRQTHSIETTRKLQAIMCTVLGAVLSAIIVAGMIYFTYVKSPARL
jgi:hypothetical protein